MGLFRGMTFSVLLFVGGLALRGSPASAQSPGSLGGYGSAAGSANPAMGGRGAMVIPYGGMYQGFMPSRMGGASQVAFRARPVEAMRATRSSFSLGPMSGGSSSMSGGMGMGSANRARSSAPIGGRMAGMGGGPKRMSPGLGVIPPSIGYPFREPPSLLSASTAAMGMGM